jgi:uncharacterized membrane protein YfcA
MNWILILLIGAVVGFLGGMFGKGGSAIATPMLAAVGVPPIVAVAAPLPATIPGTIAASIPYWRAGLVDRTVVTWSVVFGVPATVAGAVATRWIGGGPLVTITDLVLIALGVRLVVSAGHRGELAGEAGHLRLRLALTATTVGLISGLLANAGGFLLVPLYLSVLRLPIKTAFACSLAVATALAIPGTVVHAALGHIDWQVVAVFGAASIPLSNVGARVALHTQPARLERLYGLLIALLGAVFLVIGH